MVCSLSPLAGSTLIFPCPDVINVSGHRLSTAEIESALIMHKGVAETAGVFVSRIQCLYSV